MTLEERWQAVEQNVAVADKAPKGEQGDAPSLAEHLEALLGPAEGQEYLLKKLDPKYIPKRGRPKLLSNLIRALVSVQARLSQSEAKSLLRVWHAIAEASAANQETFWVALAHLQRGSDLSAGQGLLEGLRRKPRKERNVDAMLDCARKYLTDDECLRVFEAAHGLAKDEGDASDLMRSVERLRSPAQHASEACPPVPDAEQPIVAPTGVPQSARGREAARSAAGQTIAHSDRNEVAKRVAALVDDFLDARDRECQTLRMALTDSQHSVQLQNDELTKLREALAQVSAERDRAWEELDVVQQRCRGLEGQLAGLQHELTRLRDQQDRSRAEVERVTTELARARREAEETERRAQDYMHDADLEKQHAVASFRTGLWERMEPFLLEVLDGSPDAATLTREQQLFHHRLRQILDLLREMKVAR